MADTFNDASRKNWVPAGDQQPTDTQIGIGCLQRIATATELMAKNHDQLVRQRDAANANADFYRRRHESTVRQLSAMRGQVTKLKNRLAKAAAAGEGT